MTIAVVGIATWWYLALFTDALLKNVMYAIGHHYPNPEVNVARSVAASLAWSAALPIRGALTCALVVSLPILRRLRPSQPRLGFWLFALILVLVEEAACLVWRMRELLPYLWF